MKPSVRVALIKALALPILALLAGGAWFSYRMAAEVANDAYDQSLQNSALAIANRVRIIRGQVRVLLPVEAEQVLRTDEFDRVYFRVRDAQGRLITGGPRLSLGGAPLHHHMGLAAFAEYALVSDKSLVKIPPELGFVEASLFGCAVMCGAGTALYSARIAPGESVAVVGLGGVGMAAIMGARLAGATRITAVDRNANKGDLALSVGATSFISDHQTPQNFDVALDATGSVEGFELALELTRRGGRTVTVSLPDAQRRFSFPLSRLVAEARTVAGSYIGSCLPSRDIPAFIDLYRQGRLPVDRLVTRTLALGEINEAMDALADARVLRQVVVF